MPYKDPKRRGRHKREAPGEPEPGRQFPKQLHPHPPEVTRPSEAINTPEERERLRALERAEADRLRRAAEEAERLRVIEMRHRARRDWLEYIRTRAKEQREEPGE